MFRRGAVTVLTVRRVPIRLHWSLALLMPYLAFAIGVQFRQLSRAAGIHDHTLLPAWAWGILLAVGLVIGIALHELGHTIVAQRRGGKVRAITLMALGGVSDIAELPKKPAAEAWMAAIGPIVSLVLGGVTLAPGLALPLHHADARFGLIYFGQINLALGVFNLLPAFPLDGGRVLRAALVRLLGYARATLAAARFGKVMAAAVGLAGIMGGSPILLFIAIFLWLAGSAESRAVLFEDALSHVPLRRLAHWPVPRLAGGAPAEDAIELFARERPEAALVEEFGQPKGLITEITLRAVPVARLRVLRVKDVAEPLATAPAAGTADLALRAMVTQSTSAVLLTDESGQPVGVVAEADLANAARLSMRGWRGASGTHPSQTPDAPQPA